MKLKYIIEKLVARADNDKEEKRHHTNRSKPEALLMKPSEGKSYADVRI